MKVIGGMENTVTLLAQERQTEKLRYMLETFSLIALTYFLA
jgi:hypothetical protein